MRARYRREPEFLADSRSRSPVRDIKAERLPLAARAFRAFHAGITVAFLSAIVHVWRCALTGRRDRWLRIAIVSLIGEGTVVGLNHGDCPLGPLQDRLGDPVPLFEVVLSPRAARRAVPVLGIVATLGIIL